MKLCLVVLVVGLVSAGPVDMPQGALCDVCKTGITTMQNLLSDTFVGILKKGMSWACWFSPIDRCGEITNEVIDGVTGYIKGIDAHETCSKVSDCTPNDHENIFDYVDDMVCNACITKYDHVHEILKENPQIETNIKKALSNMCYLYSCDTITGVVDDTFSLMEEDSEDICKEIRLC